MHFYKNKLHFPNKNVKKLTLHTFFKLFIIGTNRRELDFFILVSVFNLLQYVAWLIALKEMQLHKNTY